MTIQRAGTLTGLGRFRHVVMIIGVLALIALAILGINGGKATDSPQARRQLLSCAQHLTLDGPDDGICPHQCSNEPWGIRYCSRAGDRAWISSSRGDSKVFATFGGLNRGRPFISEWDVAPTLFDWLSDGIRYLLVLWTLLFGVSVVSLWLTLRIPLLQVLEPAPVSPSMGRLIGSVIQLGFQPRDWFGTPGPGKNCPRALVLKHQDGTCAAVNELQNGDVYLEYNTTFDDGTHETNNARATPGLFVKADGHSGITLPHIRSTSLLLQLHRVYVRCVRLREISSPARGGTASPSDLDSTTTDCTAAFAVRTIEAQLQYQVERGLLRALPDGRYGMTLRGAIRATLLIGIPGGTLRRGYVRLAAHVIERDLNHLERLAAGGRR